jgi:hypothetical protein
MRLRGLSDLRLVTGCKKLPGTQMKGPPLGLVNCGVSALQSAGWLMACTIFIYLS